MNNTYKQDNKITGVATTGLGPRLNLRDQISNQSKVNVVQTKKELMRESQLKLRTNLERINDNDEFYNLFATKEKEKVKEKEKAKVPNPIRENEVQIPQGDMDIPNDAPEMN